jgi:DnaJ-class molecular chaperone
MKNKTNFYVIMKKTCENCNGYGVVTHPAWEEYWMHHDSTTSFEEDLKWFIENGWADLCKGGNLPPEEIICPNCNGEGIIEEVVTLEYALAQLQR